MADRRHRHEAREIAYFGLGFWAGHEGILTQASWDRAVADLAEDGLTLERLAERIEAVLDKAIATPSEGGRGG